MARGTLGDGSNDFLGGRRERFDLAPFPIEWNCGVKKLRRKRS